jgi:hypothetical protein
MEEAKLETTGTATIIWKLDTCSVTICGQTLMLWSDDVVFGVPTLTD